MIRLWVLGPTRLEAESNELRQVLAQPKRLALLAYLAVSTGFHRRDTLLAMFWPELDTGRGRVALNQALRFLRKELGTSLERVVVSRGDEEVGVDPSSLWCDVGAFRDAVDARRFPEAFDLYRGDLLTGFFATGADGFERWLDLERTHLRELAARAAAAFADQLENAGDPSGAIVSARRGVEWAGLDERAVRELLLRLDRLGDRAGAIQAYEMFANRLRRELDAEPATETQALIRGIRSRRESGSRNDTDCARVQLPRERPEVAVDTPGAGATPARPIARARLLLGVGGLAVVVGIGLMKSQPKVPAWFTLEPPAGSWFNVGSIGFPFALSRNGRTVAFVAGPERQLYVRSLAEPAAVPFPKAQRVSDLHFSPNGQAIAYRSTGSEGGPAILDLAAGPDGAEPVPLAKTSGWSAIAWTWSRDPVYAWNNSLWTVRAGTRPRQVATFDSSAGYRWGRPTVMPNGKQVVYSVAPRGAHAPAGNRLAVTSMEGGRGTVLDFEAESAIGYLDGVLIYSRLSPDGDRGQIAGIKLDLRTARTSGPPVLLVDSVDMKDNEGALAALSENGTLAYLTTTAAEVMQIIDERGAVLDEIPGLPMARQTLWSPDGKRIVLYGGSIIRPILLIYDANSRTLSRIPGVSGFWPSWSPDGNRVLFTAVGSEGLASGRPEWVPSDGSGPAETVPGTERYGFGILQTVMAPDGRIIVRPVRKPTDTRDSLHAFAIPVGGGSPVPVIPEAPNPFNLAVSPDGRWIAYSTDDGAGSQVYVRSLSGKGGRLQISRDTGSAPRWFDNGRRLLYRIPGGRFRVAILDRNGALPRVVRTEILFPEQSFTQGLRSLDIHPSGKRFVVTRDLGKGPELRVITNWATVVREKVAGR